METVAVRWNVELEGWFVSSLLSPQKSGENSDQKLAWQSFDEWASEQADLSQMRFILQGESYVCRWLTLPGVQGRHLPKALPFALEESLIEDIRNYHLVTTGKVGKFTHRIYCSISDPLKRLLEACDHRNITLSQLIPETALIPENSMVHTGDCWLINIPGLIEAKVHESALSGFFESLCNDLDTGSQGSLKLIDSSLDSLNLLKTQLESSFSDVFKNITVEIGNFSQHSSALLESKTVNLLTSQFRPEEIRKESPSAWWKPLASLAACWCILFVAQENVKNSKLVEQEEYVKAETVALYEQLFPGERIRTIERQILSKVKGEPTEVAAGVMIMLSQASKALQQNNLKQMIEWQSFRFNDRQNQLIIELTSKTLTQLQEYKSALEQQGLVVEIAQATNEANGVKGRIKIGAAA